MLHDKKLSLLHMVTFLFQCYSAYSLLNILFPCGLSQENWMYLRASVYTFSFIVTKAT